jgi:hypothetical protein
LQVYGGGGETEGAGAAGWSTEVRWDGAVVHTDQQLGPLAPGSNATSAAEVYSDAKVANRDIRVWHFATENGP